MRWGTAHMEKRHRFILYSLALLSLFSHKAYPAWGGGICGPGWFSATGRHRLIGRKSRNFTLRSCQGKELSFSKLKGKTVILTFFGSWSEQCTKHLVQLEQLLSDNPDNDFILIGITMEKNAGRVKKFVEDNDITFPVLIDGKDVFKQFKGRRYPWHILPGQTRDSAVSHRRFQAGQWEKNWIGGIEVCEVGAILCDCPWLLFIMCEGIITMAVKKKTSFLLWGKPPSCPGHPSPRGAGNNCCNYNILPRLNRGGKWRVSDERGLSKLTAWISYVTTLIAGIIIDLMFLRHSFDI